jgi:O-antigen ligase
VRFSDIHENALWLLGWPPPRSGAIVGADHKELAISNPRVPDPSRRADQLSRLSYGFALLWLPAITFSIAIAEAALWLAALTWGAAWLMREIEGDERDTGNRARGPAGDVLGVVGAPITVFFALSLLSALRSRDAVVGLLELREVFLFAAPLVTWAVFRDATRRRTGRILFAAGIFAAVVLGIYQTVTGTPAPGDGMVRATGPLGHYMTFSGVLLVAVPLLLSFRGGLLAWAARLVALLSIGMIAMTLTRSAWIGCAAALLVYAATGLVRGSAGVAPAQRLQRSRWAAYALTVGIGTIVVGLLLVSLADTDALYDRAASTFSLDDPSNVDRIAMAATGLKMIKAYPALGIGPGLMESLYPAWVVDWAVRTENPHLHNDILQIAAERGLLGLAAWLWLMAAFVLVAWRVLRSAGAGGAAGPEARAALAAMAGFLAMGMFEYNFSDSEVLMALLYVVSLPLAAAAGMPDQPSD